MNTQDKINLISEQVIHHFGKVGCTVDEVCAMVAGTFLDQGIAFGEILPLVKQIGRDNGFIVELADRKANLLADINVTGYAPQTYNSMIEWSEQLADRYSVPEKFALSSLKAMFKADKIAIPTKPQLTGWKLSALEYWQIGGIPSITDVRSYLKEEGHNPSYYTQAYHELFTALVNLKEEVK